VSAIKRSAWMLKVAVPAVAVWRLQVTSIRHSKAPTSERPRFRPAQRDAVSADVDPLAVSAARQTSCRVVPRDTLTPAHADAEAPDRPPLIHSPETLNERQSRMA
jgi:hypothetical protein